MSIKVLFITPDFYPHSTGFANACTNLVKAIAEFGGEKYKVYVYTEVPLNLLNHSEIAGIEVFRYKRKKYNKFTRIKAEKERYNVVKKLIESKKIDIIFFETNTFPFLQLWLLQEYGKKVFVRIHSTADTEVQVFYEKPTLGSQITYKYIRKFMKNVSNVVATSDFYLDFIKKYYYHQNVYTIWGDKSYSKIYNTAGNDIVVSQATGQNIFLTMGKMSANGVVQKGITDLIKAVYLLKDKNRLPNDFKLVIIGEGECSKRVKRYIEQYGLEGRIKMISKATHQEIYDYISKSKATILLSRYEGQSMFITESLAFGKPLLLSDKNGMSDMIIDGYNGFLVKTGNPYDAEEKILKIMKCSQKEITGFGMNSRKLYENNFKPICIYKQFDHAIMMRTR